MPTAFAQCDDAEARLPAVRQLCSRELNWGSVLARTYLEKPETQEFDTLPTPGLLVVLVTSGVYQIESRDRHRWRSTVYRSGSVGITAPGNGSTLRWKTLGGGQMTSLHLYLEPGLFADTEYARGDSLQGLPDTLAAEDPTVAAVCGALNWALQRRDSALYADSAAQFLAAHLALRHPRSQAATSGRGLGERALSDVVAYMHAHLAHDVTLETLSDVARLSKHHFLRAFKTSTGVTPHRFFVELRMARAATLLRSTDKPVSWVAAQCGYRNHSHFAIAFREQLGAGPARYRESMRDTGTSRHAQ